MKLYCPSGCMIDGRPYYKTREFERQPDETSCPECGGYLETGMQARAKRKARRQGGSISPASEAQREKVRGALSIISAEGPCQPTHIWDRRLGGCDDELCVIPLTAREHRDYEEKRLDILGALVAGGYHAELAHVIEAHRVSPTVLVERLTGEPYGPTAGLVRELELAHARIVELEASIAP